MGNHEIDNVNLLNKLLSELDKKKEPEFPDEETFSCNGCPLRSTCTGHVSRTMITRLSNSWDYRLEQVIIIHHNPELFQLKIIYLGNLLVDEYHESLETAKESFRLGFSHHPWTKKLKPRWTSFYPCSDWLEEINIPIKLMESVH